MTLEGPSAVELGLGTLAGPALLETSDGEAVSAPTTGSSVEMGECITDAISGLEL